MGKRRGQQRSGGENHPGNTQEIREPTARVNNTVEAGFSGDHGLTIADRPKILLQLEAFFWHT